MYTKKIRHPKPKGTREYTIYTKSEAIDRNIDFVHWKEVEIGEHGISDDDIVALCIHRKDYSIKAGKEIRTLIQFPNAAMFYNKKYPTTKYYAKGRFTNDRLANRYGLIAKCQGKKYAGLAKAVALTSDIDLSIGIAFGEVNAKKYRGIKIIAGKEEFQHMVRKEMELLLKKHGMGIDFTMTLLKDTIKEAKAKGNINALLKAVENLQNLNGMNEKGVKVTREVIATETQSLIDNLSSSPKETTRSVELKETTE